MPLPLPTSPDVPPFPSSLWDDDQPWTPRIHDVRYTTLDPDAVYQAATSGTPPNSVIYTGESVSEAADNLLEAIGRCVDNGDFTHVLSEDQTAVMSVLSDLHANILC